MAKIRNESGEDEKLEWCFLRTIVSRSGAVATAYVFELYCCEGLLGLAFEMYSDCRSGWQEWLSVPQSAWE